MTERDFRDKVMTLRHRMYGVALGLGLDPDEAADSVQVTLIHLWHKRNELPVDSSRLVLYAFVSVRNECLTRLRLRRQSEPLETISRLQEEQVDRVEQEDLCQYVVQLMKLLPEEQQKVLRLKAFEQLDNHEIALAIRQTESNVRQLLSRGRKKLKEIMQQLNK